jgi:hypothetical protein
VSDDNMLYGDVYTPSEQYGFIEVTSSVNKQHNYFYELEDVDYRIQDSIDIQYVENEQYFIK